MDHFKQELTILLSTYGMLYGIVSSLNVLDILFHFLKRFSAFNM